ncbi:hypothetical protein [Mycobacterium sp.]
MTTTTSRAADDLVIAGIDDPILPLADRILHRLLPHSTVAFILADKWT